MELIDMLLWYLSNVYYIFELRAGDIQSEVNRNNSEKCYNSENCL